MKYRALHHWVERQLGKPNLCWECGITKPDNPRYMHWANISGNYLQVTSDWRRLCALCHKRYDTNRLNNVRNPVSKRGYCNVGHKLTRSNSYVKPRRTHVLCRICRLEYSREFRKRNPDYQRNYIQKSVENFYHFMLALYFISMYNKHVN